MRTHSRHFTGEHPAALQYTRSYPGQQRVETMYHTESEMYHHPLYRTWDVSFKCYPEIFIFNLCTSTSTHNAVTARLTGHARCIYVHEIKEDHTHSHAHTDIRTYVRTRMYMHLQKQTYIRAHIRLMSNCGLTVQPVLGEVLFSSFLVQAHFRINTKVVQNILRFACMSQLHFAV